ELRREASGLLDDPGSSELQRTVARAALDLPDEPDELLDLEALRASGTRAAAYEQARKGLQQAAFDVLAVHDKDLLQELLELYDAEYAAAKDAESALDFEDLQLLARDLLRDDEAIREAEQLRFPGTMAAGSQDRPALRWELMDRRGGGPPKDLFLVGDEFQSISGFRHADVRVFRERRAAAAVRLPLTENYRSRPEVLAAVNHLFSPEFGDGFQPLTASAEFPDPVFGHPVELLVTDRASYAGTGTHWRRAGARHIPRRGRQLGGGRAAPPGGVRPPLAARTPA